jgi:uncharacterized protein (DUF2267 family)
MEPFEPEERREMRHESHAESTYSAFLKDLRWLGRMSEQEAQRAAVSVLHALEQRIVRSQARHLEAQLPKKLRELLHEAERVEGEEFRRFGKQRLFRIVARELGKEASDVEPIVRAVFAAVRMHISEGEAEHVASGLPEDLADMWRNPR